ncbi:MAG: SDR family oxidoreductase, partial [Janthinobacterium lividum]
TATKFGLRGLSESLRAELQDYPGIHICDIYPGFVDTPGVQHAGNYTGHELHPVPPDRPEQVADAIVRVALHPRDKTSVGALAKLAPLAYAVAPGLGRWAMARTLGYGLSRTPAQAATAGALFRPMNDRPAPARYALSAGVGALVLGAAALAVGAALRERR